MTNEFQKYQKKRPKLSVSEEDSTTSVSEGAAEDATDAGAEDVGTDIAKHDSGLSLHSLMARFQKIRVSNRDKRKPGSSRPSVLKEVSHRKEEALSFSFSSTVSFFNDRGHHTVSVCVKIINYSGFTLTVSLLFHS